MGFYCRLFKLREDPYFEPWPFNASILPWYISQAEFPQRTRCNASRLLMTSRDTSYQGESCWIMMINKLVVVVVVVVVVVGVVVGVGVGVAVAVVVVVVVLLLLLLVFLVLLLFVLFLFPHAFHRRDLGSSPFWQPDATIGHDNYNRTLRVAVAIQNQAPPDENGRRNNSMQTLPSTLEVMCVYIYTHNLFYNDYTVYNSIYIHYILDTCQSTT